MSGNAKFEGACRQRWRRADPPAALLGLAGRVRTRLQNSAIVAASGIVHNVAVESQVDKQHIVDVHPSVGSHDQDRPH